jgi:F-type H+-transporting ATPase subunit epsilon
MKLTITTVERTVFTGEINQATIPTLEGLITVLPNHEPLVAALGLGELKAWKADNSEPTSIFIHGGVAQVHANQVEVLTHLAENADELDEAKIEEAKRRAEKLLAERPVDIDLAKVEISLQRELAKIKLLHKWREQKH